MFFLTIDFICFLYRLLMPFWMPRTSKIVLLSTRGLDLTFFIFFEKVWTFIDFGLHFGIILRAFWHSFSLLCRHRILQARSWCPETAKWTSCTEKWCPDASIHRPTGQYPEFRVPKCRIPRATLRSNILIDKTWRRWLHRTPGRRVSSTSRGRATDTNRRGSRFKNKSQENE